MKHMEELYDKKKLQNIKKEKYKDTLKGRENHHIPGSQSPHHQNVPIIESNKHIQCDPT